MKKVFFILMAISFVGCYQVGNLPPIEDPFVGNFLVCAKDNTTGPFKTFGTLESNLKKFFDSFVVAPDGSSLPPELDYSSNINYDSRVDYQKLLNEKESTTTKELRSSILGHINAIDLNSTNNEEIVAALLNAYNFIAIDIVIQNSCEGLIKSIANLGGENSFKAFSDSINFGYQVAGKVMSLDQIEKEKIAELTNYEDARIHFAVICASAGCPVLLHKPFNKDELDEQLSFITRAGLRLPRMFENRGETTFLSQIFDWYLDDFISDIAREEDFDTDEEFIQAFVKKYTPEGTSFNINDIEFVNYDWTLNSP
ncbi:MAG: hypothetical protein CME70_17225 [Halobacteriovorax sp.]|nr:hypothetical protein [Halobacteriovorax sp.]|tara:strand:- start:91891 stop:92826 length:936 start_codon:yes stop_codon:yes gene_type:complete